MIQIHLVRVRVGVLPIETKQLKPDLHATTSSLSPQIMIQYENIESNEL